MPVLETLGKIPSESEVSYRRQSQDNIDKDFRNKFLEKDAKVTFRTYTDFFWETKANYFLIPVTLFLFLISEGIITVFYRFLADFDSVKEGTSGVFGNNFSLYWGILAGLVMFFFIALLIKYYCLNIALLKAS